jgi:monoamine oxidase
VETIIVIGAGAAGLAAANDLATRGLRVILLEARDRAGGRICTVASTTGRSPVELGAEFIHGKRNEVWNLVRMAKLHTHQVPDRHWRFAREELSEYKEFWNDLAKVTGRIARSGPDQSFIGWIARHTDLPNDVRQLALDHVEGFHAAPSERISAHAVAEADSTSERDEGQLAFRIRTGYGSLIRWLLARLLSQNVQIIFNTAVKTIQWEPGAVQVETRSLSGGQTFHGSRVLITVPLGVLQSEEGILFEPELTEKLGPIHMLGMGHAIKLTLEFRSRFWPVANFGFIHSDDEWLPTWWADERGLLLTGWAGGPRAEWLGCEEKDEICYQGFRALSRIFKVDTARIQDLLVGAYWHDWTHDSFARGAYSFTPVRRMEMPRRLAEPVADTLFFAGEATVSSGEQGTVHAALASGRRAAREAIAGINRGRIPQPAHR